MSAYRLTPQAETDLGQAALWIRKDHPEAAVRFLQSARETFEMLAQWPEAYPLARMRARRLQQMRYAPIIRPFNKWLVFYFPERRRVDVVRVIYGAMDWRSRPADFR